MCLCDNGTGIFTSQAETEEEVARLLDSQPWNYHRGFENWHAGACFPFSRFLLAGKESNVAMGDTATDADGGWPVQVVCGLLGVLWSVLATPTASIHF